MKFFDVHGKEVLLGRVLGRGGEAAVHSIEREPQSVAKIYHAHSAERAAKLKAMVDHPPKDHARQGGHVSICWPERLLFDERRQCAGFTMPKLDRTAYGEMLRFYNPADRREYAPSFTWGYLLRAAMNVSIVVEAIHARGYVIGDVNESNFFISDQALVTIVDCDSMQVRTPGRVFRCTVAKPEYLPPELHGLDLSRTDRTPEQDNFSLAILLFLLLMEGVHPFSGTWQGAGDPPSVEERIRLGESPYAGGKHVRPMPAAPPFDLLPPEIRALFVRVFGAGHSDPSARPSAREWGQALQAVKLTECKANSQHCYSEHLRSCPWCARKALLRGFDPYPDPSTIAAAVPKQQPLPARPFRRPAAPAQAVPPAASVPYTSRPAAPPWRRIWLNTAIPALEWFVPLLAALGSLLLYARASLTQQVPYFLSVWLFAALAGFFYAKQARRGLLRLVCVVIAAGTLYALGTGVSAPLLARTPPLYLAVGTFFGVRLVLLGRRPGIHVAAYQGRLLRAVLVHSLLALAAPLAITAMFLLGRLGIAPVQALLARTGLGSAALPADTRLQVCGRVTGSCSCQIRASFHRGDAVTLLLTTSGMPDVFVSATWPNNMTESVALPSRWTGQAGQNCKAAQLLVPKSVEAGYARVHVSTGLSGSKGIESGFSISR